MGWPRDALRARRLQRHRPRDGTLGQAWVAHRGVFQDAQEHFGLARFAQVTRRGAYRYLLLLLRALTLTQWQVWETPGECRDGGAAVTTTRHVLVPDIILAELTAQMERLRP